MAFTKHNFVDGVKLFARPLNEMETQIAENEKNIPISATLSGGILTIKGILGNLFTVSGFYQKPSTGIPLSDLSQEVQNKIASGGGGGLTEEQVRALINEALGVIENGTY